MVYSSNDPPGTQRNTCDKWHWNKKIQKAQSDLWHLNRIHHRLSKRISIKSETSVYFEDIKLIFEHLAAAAPISQRSKAPNTWRFSPFFQFPGACSERSYLLLFVFNCKVIYGLCSCRRKMKVLGSLLKGSGARNHLLLYEVKAKPLKQFWRILWYETLTLDRFD